ncbi:MAG: hypothetical protein JWO43_634 [Candidatus Adlerbacteria bacterium]|nr:hypothetical protein [Candidatus Adlerbacteria bacterium]
MVAIQGVVTAEETPVVIARAVMGEVLAAVTLVAIAAGAIQAEVTLAVMLVTSADPLGEMWAVTAVETQVGLAVVGEVKVVSDLAARPAVILGVNAAVIPAAALAVKVLAVTQVQIHPSRLLL